jgi:predicted ester cyclase
MSGTRELLDELFRRASAQELGGVLDLWHPDGVLEDIALARSAVGKAAVTTYLEEFFAALPDLTYTPQQVVVDGERGVVVWESETRVAQPFFGFPPSDRPVRLRGCDVFEVRDGSIRHEWSWYGDAWLASRLSDDDALVRRLMPRR